MYYPLDFAITRALASRLLWISATIHPVRRDPTYCPTTYERERPVINGSLHGSGGKHHRISSTTMPAGAYGISGLDLEREASRKEFDGSGSTDLSSPVFSIASPEKYHVVTRVDPLFRLLQAHVSPDQRHSCQILQRDHDDVRFPEPSHVLRHSHSLSVGAGRRTALECQSIVPGSLVHSCDRD